VGETERDGERAATGSGELVVPSAPRSVTLVRRYAVDVATALGWADSADTVALLVSEVATNAILHAYGPEVRVRVLDHGPRLRVEVLDGSPALPVPRRARDSAESGRGMLLVDSLAVRWGTDTRPGGKVFWFEIGI